jgi:anti-anti-sigma factor
MPDPTATTVERHQSVVVVRIQADRLDETNLTAVRSEVSTAGLDSPQLPVAIDMSNIAFLPSLSLGGLVQLVQIFKARGQRLVLANLQTAVRQTITITRLDRLFEIQDDLSALLR